jgi:hypothetical protein
MGVFVAVRVFRREEYEQAIGQGIERGRARARP